MNRRNFLAIAALAAFAPATGFAEQRSYVPGLDKQLMAEGKTLVVHFWTSWCPTCRSQERTINAIRAENPAYDEKLTFLRYDFDLFGREGLAAELGIPRRSVIVLMKDGKELDRVFLSTLEADIRRLMEHALDAADDNG